MKKVLIITIGKWRTPEPFLQALGRALRGRPEFRFRIRVRFIGEVKFDPAMAEQIPQIIQQEKLSNVVKLEPFLPHQQGLSQMIQCHCLLLIQNHLPDAPDLGAQAIGAKTSEYLRTQKPILALVPPERDVARLVRELGAGLVVAPEDIEGITRAILKLYDAFCRGELAVNSDLVQIQQFESKNQTKELAAILNATVEGRGNTRFPLFVQNFK
jgi:hypothetical protein